MKSLLAGQSSIEPRRQCRDVSVTAESLVFIGHASQAGLEITQQLTAEHVHCPFLSSSFTFRSINRYTDIQIYVIHASWTYGRKILEILYKVLMPTVGSKAAELLMPIQNYSECTDICVSLHNPCKNASQFVCKNTIYLVIERKIKENILLVYL